MSLIRRPTIADINLNALAYNFNLIRERTGGKAKILAVVKANAYGHGAIKISSELENLGVDFLGVATCEEGIELRNAKITAPIIVLGGFFKGQCDYAGQYDLTPVIYNLESAEELSQCAKKSDTTVKVHVKIDTGMGRLGMLPSETKAFFQNLMKLSNLEIGGVLSHLADNNQDDNSGLEFTQKQATIFKQQIEQLHQMGIHPHFEHLANSSALIDKDPDCFNLVRPGIILYGAYSSKRLQQKIDLKPVMNLKTKIASLKKVPKGTSISYGRTFKCKRESLIATLPIGYADGYSRHLSNKGEVLIRGTRAPIVGVVCMDMVMVDVTEVPDVSMGDDVVLMGSQGDEHISAEEIAEKIGTISYEVFCGISPRVSRIYTKGGKIL